MKKGLNNSFSASKERVGVAITGASGVRIGFRVIEYLVSRGYLVEAVITNGAFRVASYEEGLSRQSILEMFSRWSVTVYSEQDYSSPLASSSSIPRTFIVVPASMKTVAALAWGFANNLVIRAALATLRIGGRLVVAPRETPLSRIELENLLRLAEAGAIVVPLCVGFYSKPKSVDDIVDFLAGKVLDAAGIENNLYSRWGEASLEDHTLNRARNSL